MKAVTEVFPKTVTPFLISIINEVYSQSKAMIPVTILVALWSAGRGVLAITSGLNCIYQSKETRNYFYLRLRASVYTVLFLLVIISCLLLAVFVTKIRVFGKSGGVFDPNPDDPDNRSDDVVLYVVVSVSSGCEDQDEVETSDSGIGI